MSIVDVIKNRRSIRKYKNKDVSLNLLMELIDAAKWAPSSKNRQPWEFIITTDPQKIRKIAEAKGQKWIAGSPAIILGISDPNISPVYHMSDTAMAMHNISLAAIQYGLGTCWLGIYEYEEIKKMFGIPKNKVLVGALTVGYPDEDPEPKERKDIDEILCFEKYGNRKPLSNI
ncbi:MAG: nitroreductase family protein [Candidatus Njordarchaeota archaeon]